MENRLLKVLLLIFITFILIFIGINTKAVIWSSPLSIFNVTPDLVFINWTSFQQYQANITIGTTFQPINLSTSNIIAENYTQGNDQSSCNPLAITVRNANNDGSGVSNFGPGYTNFTLVFNISTSNCKPGRYWNGSFSITNGSNNAKIPVQIDVPITASTRFNGNMYSTGVGIFNGQIPANATSYQSYFFNSSEVSGSTGVLVNVSGWSSGQDIDLFLFSSSGMMIAKSISKDSTSESLSYNYLIPNTMYEIRIYGNSSSSSIPYNGNVIYSTLNVTNASDTAQYASMNLGSLNVGSFSTTNIILRNEGNLSLPNITETKELYRIDTLTRIGSSNYSFVVPDSSVIWKIKVTLNWTGSSNYSFNLYKPDGSLAINSFNKYIIANVSKAMQEEYNETTDISSGTWKLEILNITPATSYYTARISTYPTVSQWMTSNYSSTSFNTIGTSPYTLPVQINITIPNNTVDGMYEGYIKYSSNGVDISTPFKMNVNTSTLIVNGTYQSATFVVNDNYGFNQTRVFANIAINNAGSSTMVMSLSDSSGSLSCVSSGCAGYQAHFTYNSIPSIAKYTSALLNVSLNYNSSLPQGVYEGWILINTTNESFPLSSHPYSNFSIVLRLNITNSLNFNFGNIVGPNGISNVVNVSTSASYGLFDMNVTFKNDSKVTNLNILNFTPVWLLEPNTGYITPSLTIANGSNPLELNPGSYRINVTIPQGIPGGTYEIHSTVNSYVNSNLYSGEALDRSIIVNNTGLYMSTPSLPPTIMTNGTTYNFTVNVSNFGPLAASSAAISFQSSCGWTPANGPVSGSSCGGLTPDIANKKFIISPPGNNATSCLLWWVITAPKNIVDPCPGSIVGDSSTGKWFNPNGLNFTIAVTLSPTPTNTSTTTTTSTSTITPTTTSTTSAAAKYLEITNYDPVVQIQQGNSTTSTVTVANTNTSFAQDIKLSVEGISSTWLSVIPTLISVGPLNSTKFTITFTIPESAAIKDYTGLLRAVSNYDNVTENFTLRVLPSEAQKSIIIQTLASYKSNMTDLSTQINQSKAAGLNVTFVEASFLQLQSEISKVDAYVSSGDFFNAYNSLSTIRTLMDEVKAGLATAKPIAGNAASILGSQPWMIYSIVAGGAAIALVAAYIFWPKIKPAAVANKPPQKIEQPQQKTQISITQPNEESPWDQLREKWSKIKNKGKK